MTQPDMRRLEQQANQRRADLMREAEINRLLGHSQPYTPQLHRQMLASLGRTLIRIGRRLEGAQPAPRPSRTYPPGLAVIR